MQRIFEIITLSLFIVGYFQHIDACSTVQIKAENKIVVGKSYDWDIGDGLLTVNARSLKKVAFTFYNEAPVQWTSKYGSVTFNQYGVENPLAGMNEHGLVVEVMWLQSSVFPKADSRLTITELQLVQYILDNFKTAKEVVAEIPRIRVAPIVGKVHYLVCDVQNECTALELIEGKMVITPPESMIANTLTNITYESSKSKLSKYEGWGGNLAIPTGSSPLDRFIRASSMSKKLSSSQNLVPETFKVLESVNLGDYTKWNVVYDQTLLTIHYRVKANWKIRSIQLKQMDFDCKRQSYKILEVEKGNQGDISNDLRAYRRIDNQTLLNKTKSSISNIPDTMVDQLALYPETTTCQSN